jgi:transposase
MNKVTINKYIVKYIPSPKTGRKCKVQYWRIVKAILYKLKTGVQWHLLPMKQFFQKFDYQWSSVYYHFNKWCKMGVWEKLYSDLLQANKNKIDLEIINLDGSHTPAKRGGEAVGYQGRKKSKTSNLLIITDAKGCPIVCSDVVSGNHNDAFELEKMASKMFDQMERTGFELDGLFLNADAGFDVQKFKELCFRKGIIYNIDRNKRNSKQTKDESYVFDDELYKNRFTVEQCNAWVDGFRSMLVRQETSAQNWLQAHYLVFTMIFLKKNFGLTFSF